MRVLEATPRHEGPDDGARVASEAVAATVVLDEQRVKVRRIELQRGGSIPPCRMEDDVWFVVLLGRIALASGPHRQQVAYSGAVFTPSSAVARSMEALEPSLLLAVLCRAGEPLGSATATT